MGKDFGDFVDEGRELMQARDTNAWALGDLACEFEITVGRPKDGDKDVPTLSDLAREWDASTQRVSEWRNVASFYPTHVRTFDLTWSHYNQARRASDGDLNNALELLDMAVRLKMHVREFERYIKGIYFEGLVKVDQLAAGLRAMLPDSAREVWVTIKRNEA